MELYKLMEQMQAVDTESIDSLTSHQKQLMLDAVKPLSIVLNVAVHAEKHLANYYNTLAVFNRLRKKPIDDSKGMTPEVESLLSRLSSESERERVIMHTSIRKAYEEKPSEQLKFLLRQTETNNSQLDVTRPRNT